MQSKFLSNRRIFNSIKSSAKSYDSISYITILPDVPTLPIFGGPIEGAQESPQTKGKGYPSFRFTGHGMSLIKFGKIVDQLNGCRHLVRDWRSKIEEQRYLRDALHWHIEGGLATS